MRVDLDVVAIAAHRDDVELRAGGTLIRLVDQGYRVGVVDLTAGEAGTAGSAALRAREAEQAARIMGVVHRECLNLPDAALDSRDRQALRRVAEVIRRLRPALLVAPWVETRHPDHREASHLITDAVFFAGMKKFEAQGNPHRPDDLWFFPMRSPFEPSVIVDITESFARKQQAVGAYGSQFYNPQQPRSAEDETYISSPSFLEDVWAQDRYFGSLIHSRYGEPFRLCHPPEALDPVALARGRGYY